MLDIAIESTAGDCEMALCRSLKELIAAVKGRDISLTPPGEGEERKAMSDPTPDVLARLEYALKISGESPGKPLQYLYLEREDAIALRDELRRLQSDNARLRKIEDAANNLVKIVLDQTSGYSSGPGKVAADAAREVKALVGKETK